MSEKGTISKTKSTAGNKGLDGKAILIFSNMRFDSPIEATSLFLARHFAETNPVYFIDYPLTYTDYFRNKNEAHFIARKDSFFNASHAVIATETPNMKRVTLPFVLPLNFLSEGKLFRMLLKFSEGKIVKRIKQVLKNEGVKDFVFINSFNFHYPNVGPALKPALNIYQCVDPMITPYDLKHGFVSELQLVKESDMVICTSKSLYRQKIKTNPNTWFVPNAADTTHSSKALDKDLQIHLLLADVKKPIIGYFGSIERRIDYDIMHDVIKDNPDKSFVFAGPMYREHVPEWMFNTQNVYLPGPIPYDEMPQMLKGFDIAIIPFKKDDVSDTIFPLKLFEYLGAGKPVVITDFNPDMKEYTGNAVNYCADADAFSKAINDSLANNSEALQAERVEVAEQNTWSIRAKQIAELMDKELRSAK